MRTSIGKELTGNDWKELQDANISPHLNKRNSSIIYESDKVIDTIKNEQEYVESVIRQYGLLK